MADASRASSRVSSPVEDRAQQLFAQVLLSRWLERATVLDDAQRDYLTTAIRNRWLTARLLVDDDERVRISVELTGGEPPPGLSSEVVHDLRSVQRLMTNWHLQAVLVSSITEDVDVIDAEVVDDDRVVDPMTYEALLELGTRIGGRYLAWAREAEGDAAITWRTAAIEVDRQIRNVDPSSRSDIEATRSELRRLWAVMPVSAPVRTT